MLTWPLLFSRKHLHAGSIKKGRLKAGPSGKDLLSLCLAHRLTRHELVSPCLQNLTQQTTHGNTRGRHLATKYIWQLLVQLGNHYTNHTAWERWGEGGERRGWGRGAEGGSILQMWQKVKVVPGKPFKISILFPPMKNHVLKTKTKTSQAIVGHIVRLNLKKPEMSWREDSVLKGACCSCRGPCSVPAPTWILEVPMPFSGSQLLCACCAQKHLEAEHPNT